MTNTGKVEIFTRESEILTQKSEIKNVDFSCMCYKFEFSLFRHFDFSGFRVHFSTFHLNQYER